ncbi:uncharacterized protein LOC114544388 [Dendronephthya gigantea]|uniref:uncharacterized protein LOC114544388 n=1 Tax=Dendronephthya gigantea TaxID=151771 RepID=UPI00106B6214|nr:uncharacterized protein LOC114544388 [Dendronephthya gigantea]
MAESKSGRKKKTSAEHMARLADMVRENSQKKKKPVQVVFKRHPSTGMRIHTSKYRPGRKNIRPTATATGKRPACLSPERTLEERELSGDISWDSEMCTEIDSDHDSICKSDALDNLIIETQMFLDNCKKKKVMSWKERKKNANICWESSRPKIFKAMVEMQTPGEALCSICEEISTLMGFCQERLSYRSVGRVKDNN